MKPIFVILILIASSCSKPEAQSFLTQDQLTFLQIIQVVETGGHRNPANALGSFSEYGPLQITYAFWYDATEYDDTISGVFSDVRDVEYAQRIADAYFQRWAYGQWLNPLDNVEHLAATFNGGPRGPQKKATEPYVQRVKVLLAAIR